MRQLLLPLYIIFFAALSLACKKKTSAGPQDEKPGKLRVLGYLLSDNNWHNAVNSIDLDAITDLNLAFLNPGADGSFSIDPAVKQVVDKARAAEVRVFMSIGGGDAPTHLAELIKPAKRSAFVAGIVALMDQHGFAGVDVDLENELINADYPAFVAELRVALTSRNKLMTAALASWNADKIPDATMRNYDFINIMSYDKTGPWNPGRPGPHSPYDMAVSDFNYFNQARGVAAEKLLIGLPFYGYGFGAGAPSSIWYKDLVAQYAGAENADEVTVNGGGKIYYNGPGTIRRKVAFALSSKAAGVMIWELTQDSRDAKSLLKAVNGKISE
ncbi:glycosyl hydrolase family 18 protein [Chitinophaga sp. 22620]|uniref:glycosyl hydrolase family 18 protein n=1 Tax=Chitinophaga sp. 22620 TaxID=3453952 RepID=UPI003F82849D